MTYTELYEFIYGADSEGISNRINSLDPLTRKAWDIIKMLLDRKGFEYWWVPSTHEGMPAECNDEIFEELKRILAA
jgi:hypothetical protein